LFDACPATFSITYLACALLGLPRFRLFERIRHVERRADHPARAAEDFPIDARVSHLDSKCPALSEERREISRLISAETLECVYVLRINSRVRCANLLIISDPTKHDPENGIGRSFSWTSEWRSVLRFDLICPLFIRESKAVGNQRRAGVIISLVANSFLFLLPLLPAPLEF
jgi:hypothetical protein